MISNKALNPGQNSAYQTKLLTNLGGEHISLPHPGDVEGVLAKQNTLGVAQRELMFPTAALPVLCSVLAAGKVLITLQCLEHGVKALSPTLLTCGGQNVGKGHSQDS